MYCGCTICTSEYLFISNAHNRIYNGFGSPTTRSFKSNSECGQKPKNATKYQWRIQEFGEGGGGGGGGPT